jgi:hypothetical protein
MLELYRDICARQATRGGICRSYTETYMPEDILVQRKRARQACTEAYTGE